MNEPLQGGTPRVPHKVRFLDFMPDADPLTPGAVLDMSNLYPSVKGYRSYPSLTRYSANALSSECKGAFTALMGTELLLVAGTIDQLFVLAGTQLVDQGLSITQSTGRWRFDMYHGHLIAVNGANANLHYDGASWTNLGGSPPVASIVQATEHSLFLILANSNDWISSLNHDLWTPSIATQTVTGELAHGSGNITAAHRLRGGIALYKRKHISFGQFSGPPFYWDFGNGVSDQIGTPSQEAVANLGDVHYFPGPGDFYSFDGYSLQPVPNNLKEWFFDNLNQTLDHLICARWDQQRSLIFWHFPSINANPETSLDSWICFNIRTGKWSADRLATPIDMPLFATVQIGQLTYDVLTQQFPTYGDMNFAYGDLRSRSLEQTAAIRSSDHALHIYNGLPGAASLTTHDFGDRESLYQVTRVEPDYAIYPEDGATLEILNQAKKPGTTPVAGPSRALSEDGKFNIINTAKLQRFKHTGSSEYEITGIKAAIEYAGEQ